MSSMAHANPKSQVVEPWLSCCPMEGGETYEMYAMRLFQEYWPRTFSDHLLHVLAVCLELEHKILRTIADGTLWLPDEPNAPEPDLAACAKNFLQRLESLRHRRAA